MSPPRAPEENEARPALPSACVASHAADAPDPPEVVDRSKTDRDILRLTWPVVAGQVMANAVNLIDIFMLGRLGTETLAAVGYATQFLFLVQACLMAIGSACVAMMARAIGGRDSERARRAFGANLILALSAALVIGGVAVALPRALLHLLAVPEPVVDLAVPYFRLTLGSAGFLAVSLTYEHAFRAARDTVRPMLIAAVVSLTKLGLNFLLIFGLFGLPRLDLMGAGLATLIASLLGCLLFISTARRHTNGALALRLRDLRNNTTSMGEAWRLALPAVSERLVMTVAIMTYFRFLGDYGVAAVAAYNVGVRILSFTWIPGHGLSVAASTLVGQALGAGKPLQARSSGWRATGFGLLISVSLGTFFILWRVPMAELFTQDPEVIHNLDSFILVLGCSLPFLVSHFTLAGALRGAGDTVTPLMAASLGNWAFRVPVAFLFASVFHADLIWLWTVMLMDHLVRAIWLTLAFHRGRWDAQLGLSTAATAPTR